MIYRIHLTELVGFVFNALNVNCRIQTCFQTIPVKCLFFRVIVLLYKREKSSDCIQKFKMQTCGIEVNFEKQINKLEMH